MKRNNKKGFTIVELVIVIAVIAILSAVLIPTFGGIIDDANNTARDQEAKNLYTEFIIENKNVVESGNILVVDGTDKYYYPIVNSQIDLEHEVKNPTESTSHVYCNDSACATCHPTTNN